MKANIQLLYSSPLFRISDFKCLERAGTVSRREWVGGFHISFARKGNFGYKVARDFCDIHSGTILLENANTEYTVSHAHHVKDECTTFCIEESLLTEISLACSLQNPLGNFSTYLTEGFKFPSPVIQSTPELDYLHMLIYQNTSGNSNGQPLKIDLLVVALLNHIFAHLSSSKQIERPVQLDKRLKDLHLETIDRGKSYILNNFQNEMNLSDIARHAYVSPFHFSRLFKYFTSCTPYRYLLEARLNHAATLLRNTSFTVTEICFESGFNSLEHFIATFTRRHGSSPRKFRHLPSC